MQSWIHLNPIWLSILSWLWMRFISFLWPRPRIKFMDSWKLTKAKATCWCLHLAQYTWGHKNSNNLANSDLMKSSVVLSWYLSGNPPHPLGLEVSYLITTMLYSPFQIHSMFSEDSSLSPWLTRLWGNSLGFWTPAKQYHSTHGCHCLVDTIMSPNCATAIPPPLSLTFKNCKINASVKGPVNLRRVPHATRLLSTW